jgi:hypothetical protein
MTINYLIDLVEDPHLVDLVEVVEDLVEDLVEDVKPRSKRNPHSKNLLE